MKADIRAPFEFPQGNGRIYNGNGQLFIEYHAAPDGQLIVRPYGGELDVFSAPSFRRFLIDAAANGYFSLVVSLEHIEFLDSTGLGVLVGGLKRARSGNGYLDIVCTQERILKMFRITGLTKVYGIFSTVLDALDARGPDMLSEDVGQEIQPGDWIPIRLYMTDARHHQSVEAALKTAVEEFGLEVNYEFPPSYNSYWREFGGRFKTRTTTPDEVDARMRALEKAIQFHLVDQRQSVISDTEAGAVAELIAAVRGTANAVIQIGTVILIKCDDTLWTRNLSPIELIYYERDPRLFRDPKAALRALQAIAEVRNGQARGRHPRTGTVHLVKQPALSAYELYEQPVLLAQCGRTAEHLQLEIDGTITCGSCRHMALQA